jgi:DNA polymerase I
VRTIKTAEKLLSSFGTQLAARVSKDGRLRASFNLAGAKTGRMRCSSPNLQNLPRDPAFRNCFVASPGHVLVVGDYSSMELRAVAEIADDAMLRKDFADGFNPHRRLAASMFGIPESAVTPEQRQAAKPINFGVIYGAGAQGLAASAWAAYRIALTLQDAQAAKDRFLNRYRRVAAWMRSNADACQRKGVIAVGKHGRVIRAEWEGAKDRGSTSYRRNYSDNDDDYTDDAEGDGENGGNGYEGEDLNAFYNNASDQYRQQSSYNQPPSPLRYTLCCNGPVQGGCADIIMRAMVLVERALAEAGIPGGLVLAVHDELVLEVPEAKAAEAAKLLDACMTRAFAEYFPDAPINRLVDIHVVRKWGDAKA